MSDINIPTYTDWREQEAAISVNNRTNVVTILTLASFFSDFFN